MVYKNWYDNWIKLGFIIQFLHLGLNLFKNTEKSGNSIVYMWKWRGIVRYIGKGVWDRPFTHSGDMLSRILDSSWELVIVAEGLTDQQACTLEAKLIRIAKKYRRLSVRGSYEWDGVSLINKITPRTYKGISFEDLFEQHLNLNDRNWTELERELSNY